MCWSGGQLYIESVPTPWHYSGVSFEVPADAYDRFMGRYADLLAPIFADFAGVQPGQCALDVGCGPGALTAELVRRLGAGGVSAVDPSRSFVDAVGARLPGVVVELGSAELLPFGDGAFDSALAQLVVHFMTDAVAGLEEMARVTRPGGCVAACVWDLAGARSPMAIVYRAMRDVDPAALDESERPGAGGRQLAELFESAGLRDAERTELTVAVRYETFDDWWQPYTLGVGPAGAFVASLGDERRTALRARCGELLGAAPFDITATAWAVRALV